MDGCADRNAAADFKDYAARFHLGLANSLLGKDTEAIADYKTALELKPGLYEAQLNLGVLLIGQKQPREAAALLESAVTTKPREFRPNFYLAEALLADGDTAKAERFYKIAEELDPKSLDVQLGLARSRARQGRLDEASANYRRAAGLDAGLSDILLELAAAYESTGQPAAAIEIYKQFPGNAGARERLASLLIAAGKPAEAAPLLEQALAAEPRNPALRMMYGRALRDLKRYPAAAAEFYRVTELQPDSVTAWSDLAATLFLANSYPQALAALDRLKALGAEVPVHYYLRAIMLDKAGQPKPALENYQKFLALSQEKHPEEEFKARQRARILQKEVGR